MNTSKSASKQEALTTFRMNTYAKHRGRGHHESAVKPLEPQISKPHRMIFL
jgi:hypothetical protein